MRVLRLKVSVWGRGYGVLSGFPPFSLSETVRGCVSLKDKTRQETKDEKWTRKNKTMEVSVKDKVDKEPKMREGQ